MPAMHATCQVFLDERFLPLAGKVGVELLRHAAALLHDSRGAACVRGGIDVGEALAVETDSGRTHNVRRKLSVARRPATRRPPPPTTQRPQPPTDTRLRLPIACRARSENERPTASMHLMSVRPCPCPQLILVRAFNAAFGTALRPDPALASSDWAAPRLSQAQLAHAAMNAFMAWALGAARGCALLRHEDRRTVCVPAPPSQLLNVCPMLRECEAALRGEAKASEVELHSAEVVEGAADRGNTGLGNELRLHMARYETKVRRMDEVEVRTRPAARETFAVAGSRSKSVVNGGRGQLQRVDRGLPAA